jgi:hypothetical protein
MEHQRLGLWWLLLWDAREHLVICCLLSTLGTAIAGERNGDRD